MYYEPFPYIEPLQASQPCMNKPTRRRDHFVDTATVSLEC